MRRMGELFGIFNVANGGAGTTVIDPPIAGADSATTQINPHHAQRRRTDSLERLALCLDVAIWHFASVLGVPCDGSFG